MSNKIKVLIVEDDFILYEELCEFFEEAGFDIVREDEDKAVDNYDDALKLLKDYEPDIAVLDIKLKGPKDGIHIAAYIKEHYKMPVIYLSAHPTPGNLERIRAIKDEHFVIKADKPLDKKQLWTDFYLLLPNIIGNIKGKTIGRLFELKEIDSSRINNRYKAVYDPVELRKFIHWDEILYFRSYNATSNNNIMIRVKNGKSYITRNTISATEQQIPDYFGRPDQSTIVNIKHITDLGKSNTFCLINEESFPITDTYRKTFLEKINMYMLTNTQ